MRRSTRGRAERPGLLRFAFLITRDHERAEDSVQEALTAVSRRFGRLVDTGGPQAYVRRSILNAAISHWRKDSRHLSVDHLPDLSVPVRSGQVADAVVADQLLATLPIDQRAAVVLRYFEDRSFAEIADLLGCRESNARSHVHRALASLRTHLEEDR